MHTLKFTRSSTRTAIAYSPATRRYACRFRGGSGAAPAGSCGVPAVRRRGRPAASELRQSGLQPSFYRLLWLCGETRVEIFQGRNFVKLASNDTALYSVDSRGRYARDLSKSILECEPESATNKYLNRNIWNLKARIDRSTLYVDTHSAID